MRKLIILFFLSFSITANCQNYIDKVIITKNLYTARYNKSDSLYKSENKTITSKKAIFKIIEELKNIDSKNYLLSKYKIDTTFIKNNLEEILKLYSNKLEFDWNYKQKEFIFSELGNINNYKKELDEYLNNGCCYTMHNFYKNEYVINFYKNSNLTNQLKSRKYVWGYKFPWSDNNGNLYFDYEIDKIIEKAFNEKSKITAPKTGDDLLKYLVNKIINNNAQNLYKLSPYTYENEINKLKKEFNIISFEEIYGYGRYIGLEKSKVIKITLHNEKMLPNINLQFLASVDKSIYPKDSLLSDYERVINRIQNIKFIKNYITQNSDSKIDVYFFNNKPINKYNIESINTNPTEWKKQDEYVESLKWYEKNNIKPTFDIKEAIKTSERNNCGCNYRFEKSFIEKGMFFEFFDENDNSTIWILLPDNNALLYIMDNQKALDLNLNEFEESYGIKFPCKLFNSDGIEIKK